MERAFKVELGDKVKDKVTGYEGTAVSRHTYLNGCNRYGIQGALDKDGKIPDPVSFDEPQLIVVVKVGEEELAEQPERRTTGGPEKFMPADRPTG